MEATVLRSTAESRAPVELVRCRDCQTFCVNGIAERLGRSARRRRRQSGFDEDRCGILNLGPAALAPTGLVRIDEQDVR
jgi:hypothetical protein